MSDSGPDPQFITVELTGRPEHVAAFAGQLGSVSRILYDTTSAPDVRGDISRRMEVVVHHHPPAPGQPARASVTLQVVADVDNGAWQDPAFTATTQETVSSALRGLPGVQSADIRVVAVAAVPDPQQ